MEQPFGKYLMFENRLNKVYRHLSKQAKRQGIMCYRVYDHDIPEFPFLIEMYGSEIYVAEYKRHYKMEEVQHEKWLEESMVVISKVTGIEVSHIYVRERKRKENRQDQYQKVAQEKAEFVVEENGLKFIVNLTDYLDTGLFLDHRITRQMVRNEADGKDVLNLFAYTGSFSVYAAAGKAKRIVTMDLSKTYLNWAERNMQLNFPEYTSHELVHMDVKQYLQQPVEDQFDIIIMDPPTFSNSKRMEDILDIQRDHVELINGCLKRLRKGGVLYFSTNYTKFMLDRDKIAAASIADITKATTPFDFVGKLNRWCFKIQIS